MRCHQRENSLSMVKYAQIHSIRLSGRCNFPFVSVFESRLNGLPDIRVQLHLLPLQY